MRNKVVELIGCDRLVLNTYATNYCAKVFNELSMMELWIFLLNYCDEEIARQFMINYRNEDPVAYLDQRIPIINWFESHRSCEHKVSCNVTNLFFIIIHSYSFLILDKISIAMHLNIFSHKL